MPKFSHVTNTDKHPKGIAATLLQERVNAEMNGKACLEVFPNSTLYNDNKVLEAMLQGDVQLAAPSLSKFEKFTKQFRLFDLPFMFKNIDAVDAFQASEAGQAMLDSMQRRGLQGLAYWHNGMKQMSASKPLVSPSDANGAKKVMIKMLFIGGCSEPLPSLLRFGVDVIKAGDKTLELERFSHLLRAYKDRRGPSASALSAELLIRGWPLA